MPQHYQDQPLFREPTKEDETPVEREVRERNRRASKGQFPKDIPLKYWCVCGRKATIFVYCKPGEAFLHPCPACGRECVLEANPVNPAKAL